MKYIYIALSVIAGIFIGINFPKNETPVTNNDEPFAVLEIKDEVILPLLTWKDISAIASPLIERDLLDLKINDLNWRLVGCGDVEYLPEHDILILDDACSLQAPSKELQEWIKRNEYVLASVSFGDSISFNTVTWLCDLLEKNNIYSGLSTYTNSNDSILIDRYWADERWKPKMIN